MRFNKIRKYRNVLFYKLNFEHCSLLQEKISHLQEDISHLQGGWLTFTGVTSHLQEHFLGFNNYGKRSLGRLNLTSTGAIFSGAE